MAFSRQVDIILRVVRAYDFSCKAEFEGEFMKSYTIENLCKLFEKGIQNNQDRAILGQSLFYYCCGKDPTPIIAFGHDYPLYIYSDIVDYGSGDFDAETQILYERLEHAGFQLCDMREVKLGDKSVLTMWNTLQEKSFFLLYVKNDASEIFDKIYFDNEKNDDIKPKCICNYRYEFFEGIRKPPYGDSNHDFFNRIEKRIEYIFGYCDNEKYQCIGEYDYYGDYGKNTKVPLFQRMFWYFR